MNPLPQTTDVAIIGGGPAGAASGIQLARAGLQVTILEKEKFPRFCIGESLLPCGNDLLRELGVWDKIESAGYLKKFGADFCSGDGSRLHRFWFKQNLGAAREYTFQVDRASFDKLLLDHARGHGCEVREQTRVCALEGADTDTLRLGCSGPDGDYDLQARWVIDASGRNAFAGARVGLQRLPTLKSRRIAIYGHFEGVARNEGKAEGHIAIVRLRDTWFWFIPLAHGRTSVGVVIPKEKAGAGAGRRLEEIFQAAVEASSDAKARMAEARAVSPLAATGDYSWRFSSFATQRVILTGDAAGFLDPVFSSGVTLALKSALRASALLVKADAEQRPLKPSEQSSYTKEITRWMNEYSKIIRVFYTAAGFEVFMSPSPFLGIPRSIARLVGGDVVLGTADRARLKVFRMVCRLQSMMPIVPAIPSLR